MVVDISVFEVCVSVCDETDGVWVVVLSVVGDEGTGEVSVVIIVEENIEVMTLGSETENDYTVIVYLFLESVQMYTNIVND